MGSIARSYFQNLFNTANQANFDNLLTRIDRCVCEEDNRKLTEPYTKEEVREALFKIHPTKAPGEDGFPALFYKKCWHFIGEEVMAFCLLHLNGGMEVSSINLTHIVLITKINDPVNMTHFRPISLCNVIYKIMAKAIANRFRGIIDKCIDSAQSAFLPGRLISDNVLLAYELLHTLKQKRTGKKGFMAVKIDMSKAYDRIEWDFVLEIMLKMGFATKWIDSLMNCMSTVSYQVVVNGSMGEIFNPKRGLRQGIH